MVFCFSASDFENRMESDSQSQGVWPRLVNFIRRKLNRPPSNEVTVEEGLPRKGTSFGRNGFLGSEIVVEFRHRDGSEISTQINHGTIQQNSVDDKKERNKDDWGEGVQRNVTIKEGNGEGKKMKKKEAHEDTKLKPVRLFRPLLSVDSNINEKCEEYIERTRKSIEESYEQKQQS